MKGISQASLERHFAAHVPGATPPLRFEPIVGGHSNLTYHVFDAAGHRFVLRRPPTGAVLATAHDMGREHRILSALAPTGVPVPKPLALCLDPAVNDAPFYVMTWVEGEVLTGPEVAERTVPPERREALGLHVIETLAALHRLDPDAVGLGDLGRREAYLARQLARWKTQWERSRTRALPEMDEAHAALAAHVPEQTRSAIVHGDYRLGNFLVDGAAGRINAVLDWELCTLGDPLADLGYLMNDWNGPGDLSPNASGTGISATSCGGFPSRERLLERYESLTGLSTARIDYYRAFQYWRLAAIVEGVLARYMKGVMGDGGNVEAFRAQVDALARAAVELASSAGRAARLGLGLLLAGLLLATPAARAQRVAVPTPPDQPPIPVDLLENERNTIEVFRAAGASVVFVTNNALRRDFFSANVTEVPQGSGSGFLWDEYGHVVTNYHVVERGQTFSVTLADGTTHEARVVGVEPRKDLAVLHIETKGLTFRPLPVGRSDALLVGQKVIAIGNPFGLDRTLTTGVISALGREFPTAGGFVIEDVIQTDASINPGNSGGPLLDSYGRAIGVNTAIFSPSGASAGIGFAIPIDTVARIVPQLIRYGKVRRAGLGVTVLPDHFARSWGITGVIVREVAAGSGAARAGLRSLRVDRRGMIVGADIIRAVAGRPIKSFAELSNVLDDRRPGERVAVEVLRDGKDELRLEIPLVELE